MNRQLPNLNTQDKGINVDIDISEAHSNFPSLNIIQSQLIQVIDSLDAMEPQYIHASSNDDADNEDSVKHVNKKEAHTPYESPREVVSDITKVSYCSDCQKLKPQDVTIDRPPQVPQPICVPAVLPPAVLCMNPGCVCTHTMGYMQQIPAANNPLGYMQQIPAANNPSGYMQQIPAANNPPVPVQTQNVVCSNANGRKHKLSDFIQKFSKTSKESDLSNKELYKINFIQPKGNGSLPKRFVFDLVQNEVKPEVTSVATNTKACNEATCPTKNLYVNEIVPKTRQSHRSCRGIYNTSYSAMGINNSNELCSHNLEQAGYYKNLEEKNTLTHQYERDAAKVDVYYFDHGNSDYYRTTDSPPIITTELLAEKTETYATKFWAELFGTMYFVFAFVTTFILQLFRFLLYSIVRPLTIGLLQLLSDYFFKPVLAAIFNAVLQPPLIFLYNIATSLRDLCEPLADGLGYFIREIAVICKSIRLFEIKQDRKKQFDTTAAVCTRCECKPN